MGAHPDLSSTSGAGNCPMVAFVNLIAGKWAIPILYRLIVEDGPVRFGVLQRAATPITQKELTRHLRLFEAQGLVSRTAYPEMPPRVDYQITDLGRTLRPTLESLADWMRRYGPEIAARPDAPPSR
ncbi:MAG: helix-turn-helix transcriptional regulator [Telmatospirillum sp.]|nr:helix-turn-helix transcriptional regulator [Telmatospirillum sp.]